MLGKLLKYEFKAYSRIFLPIYALVLAMAILGAIFGTFSDVSSIATLSSTVLIIVISLLMGAVFVLSVVMIIKRFRQNLLSDEGYLMFTLPTSSSNLVISKYMVSMLFSLLNLIVAVLVILFMALGTVKINDILSLFNTNWLSNLSGLFSLSTWSFLLAIFLGYSLFIFKIYLSLSIGQLPIFNNARTVMAFVCYFVISFVTKLISSFITDLFIPGYNGFNLNTALSTLNEQCLISSIIDAVFIGIIFLSISYILNKKLNLE